MDRFCVYCKYFNSIVKYCNRPHYEAGISLVTGDYTIITNPASEERMNFLWGDSCGKEGKYFERKEKCE